LLLYRRRREDEAWIVFQTGTAAHPPSGRWGPGGFHSLGLPV